MILRGGGSCQTCQCLAIVPRHPLRWASLQLLGVSLQLREVVERISFVQFTGVDQTHEQIADSGAVQRLIEEWVFAIQGSRATWKSRSWKRRVRRPKIAVY